MTPSLPQILDLLKQACREAPKQVHPDAILPLGHSAAFAIGPDGNLMGVKCQIEVGAGETAQRLLNALLAVSHLRRLVIISRGSPIQFPDHAAAYQSLEYIWLSGSITKLPRALLISGLGCEFVGNEHVNDTLEVIRSLEAANSFEPIPADIAPAVTELWKNRRGLFVHEKIESVDPPVELLRRGTSALRAYFRDGGSSAPSEREVKVILVGDGSCGKTSLVRRLNGEAFNPSEHQTHGISISATDLLLPDGNSVRANFWDFGGQEIMHATHQFFLSKRSMYILLLDGRKEEDPEYWLHHIESFGGGSPILVVLNKIDEHPSFDVNRRFLQSKYPGIQGFIRASCATGFGISEVRNALCDALGHVPILSTRWPPAWYQVRRELSQTHASYITLEQFRNVCAKADIRDEESCTALVEFLNDLGVVVHFPDLQLVDTHVLDPEWATGGVYRLINSVELARQRGVLTHAQIRQLLSGGGGASSAWPAETHNYIVELMLKFELCYRLGTDMILVPDLLDVQEPPLPKMDGEAIHFVFEYAYLPRSIMPRLIVRLHQDIVGQQRWRSGMYLKDPNSNAAAIVRSDVAEKRIYIDVEGPHRRDYFSSIRKSLNEINASFERLQVTEFVRLPDTADVLVDLRELVGHEIARRSEIFVGRIGRSYSVPELLGSLQTDRVTTAPPAYTVVVQGNYMAAPFAAPSQPSKSDPEPELNQVPHQPYRPKTWERVVTYVGGVGTLLLVGYLLVRNQPIADPNLAVVLRFLTSLLLASLGATVPGFLNVGYSKGGFVIRGFGALGLFVLSFLWTPTVL